jgi:alkylmercury lyase
MDSKASRRQEAVLGAAFRHLLDHGKPLTVDDLAAMVAIPAEDVEAELRSLAVEGRVRRDRSGDVVGILGLSLEPTDHEIVVAGRRRWTWCAYDAVGILGALGRGGLIRSRSPLGGTLLEIAFDGGRSVNNEIVLFVPDGPVESVVDEWCPHVNFFLDAAAAARWSDDRGLSGEALPIDDLTRTGAEYWGQYVKAAS